MPGDPAADDRAKRYLEALREELQALGMASELVPSASEPQLLVDSPHFWRDADSWLESHVLAAQVAGTGWCYWWQAAALDAARSLHEVIGLLSDHEIGTGTPSRTRGARLPWTGRELMAGA